MFSARGIEVGGMREPTRHGCVIHALKFSSRVSSWVIVIARFLFPGRRSGCLQCEARGELRIPHADATARAIER